MMHENDMRIFARHHRSQGVLIGGRIVLLIRLKASYVIPEIGQEHLSDQIEH